MLSTRHSTKGRLKAHNPRRHCRRRAYHASQPVIYFHCRAESISKWVAHTTHTQTHTTKPVIYSSCRLVPVALRGTIPWTRRISGYHSVRTVAPVRLTGCMSRHRYRKRSSYSRGRYRARRSYGRPRRRRRRSRSRNRYYSRGWPRRRSKSRSMRSTGRGSTKTADLLVDILSMPNEVIAALAAGVLSAFGAVALVVLKVALWIVCVTAIAMFAGLMIVGTVVLAQRSALRLTRNLETTTEDRDSSVGRELPASRDADQISP